MVSKYNLSKPRFSLQAGLSAVFLTLVLSVAAVLGGLSYINAVRIIDDSVDEILQRTTRAASDRTAFLFAPAKSTASMLAASPLLGASDEGVRFKGFSQLVRGLRQSGNITAVYTGNAQGDFLLVRRVPEQTEALKQFNPPKGTRYIVQSIDRDDAGNARGRFIYLDNELGVLLDEPRADYVTYDPRKRPWYTAAIPDDKVISTDPYVFFTTREVGATLARRGVDNGFVAGVDITLTALGAAMAENQITVGSTSLMTDADGRIVAHSDAEMVASLVERDGKANLVRKSLHELDDHVLQVAFERFGDAAEKRMTVQDKGRDWVVMGHRLQVTGGKDYLMILSIPEDELLVAARSMIGQVAIVFGVILAVSMFVVLFIARKVTRPLRELHGKADAVRRFEFDNGIRVKTMISDVDELSHAIDMMEDTIQRFLEINSAIAGEGNFDRLTERLLDEIIATTHTEAGILYLTSDDDMRLEPHTGRLHRARALHCPTPDILISASDTVVVRSMADKYALGAPATEDELKSIGLDMISEHMDEAPRYLLAAPLFNRGDEPVGVLLLLQSTEMDSALVRFTEALSGSAAVSVETRRLILAQKKLFESFIRLIAGAIDAKSPYTGGHCERVPELTKMLASAAAEADEGPYKDFSLDDEEWEAIHVAAWLHDCGKITMPEYIVDKATKLETIHDRIHEVRMRVEVMKREREIVYLKDINRNGDSGVKARELEADLKELDEDFEFLAKCNIGGEFMSDEDVERIRNLASKTWTRTLDDRAGISHDELLRREQQPPAPLPVREPLLADKAEHVFERSENDRIPDDNQWGFDMEVPDLLYNRGEVHNLMVRRGTLTAEDRYKINEHIVQTIKMLDHLDFPKHLRHVPELAGGHHEKMDGTGYPRKLRKEDMPEVARMMAIADVFEALTAVDRPYKKGKTLSQALGIMKSMTDENHLDPDLFDLFLSSGVYADYARTFMRPDQIDDFDVQSFRSCRN